MLLIEPKPTINLRNSETECLDQSFQFTVGSAFHVLHYQGAEMQKKLTQLAAKAAEKGHWSLVAAAARATHSDTVDDRINVIGAMHEVGLLKNSVAPFSKTWREGDATGFSAGCVRRLVSGDADYWALAALLGVHVSDAASAFLQAGFELLAMRKSTAFKDPELHVATLALRNPAMQDTLAPLIELGWVVKTGELYDVSRWRAVILKASTGVAPNLKGKGFGSYFMRAKLPYGSWRIQDESYALESDDGLQKETTLWPTI